MRVNVKVFRSNPREFDWFTTAPLPFGSTFGCSFSCLPSHSIAKFDFFVTLRTNSLNWSISLRSVADCAPALL